MDAMDHARQPYGKRPTIQYIFPIYHLVGGGIRHIAR